MHNKFMIIFCGTITICSGVAYGVSDARTIRSLIEEKNEKLAVLEQCTKKVSGFKAAGISTIGLTAVGIAGNVMLSKKNKEMDSKIQYAQKELTNQQEKLAKTESETKDLQKTLAEKQTECEQHSDIARWDGKKCVCKDSEKTYINGECKKPEKDKSENQKACEEHTDIAKWNGTECVCKDDDKIYNDGKCEDKQSDCLHINENLVNGADKLKDGFIAGIKEIQNTVNAENICDMDLDEDPYPILLDESEQHDDFNAFVALCKREGGTVKYGGTSNEIKKRMIQYCENNQDILDSLRDTNICETPQEVCETLFEKMPRMRTLGCKCN